MLDQIDIFVCQVCEQFNTTYEEMYKQKKRRDRNLAMLRQFIFYYIRKYTDQSYYKIGRIFDKNHATAIYADHTIKALLKTDKKAQFYNEILEPIAISILLNKKVPEKRYKMDEVCDMVLISLGIEAREIFIKHFNYDKSI